MERTMAISRPYLDITPPYKGNVTETQDDLNAANHRIGVDEALRVNTLNGAYASYEEKIKGSIAVGKLADFVILADDPHVVDKEKIKDIEIISTVTGGKLLIMHDRQR